MSSLWKSFVRLYLIYELAQLSSDDSLVSGGWGKIVRLYNCC